MYFDMIISKSLRAYRSAGSDNELLADLGFLVYLCSVMQDFQGSPFIFHFPASFVPVVNTVPTKD